MIAQESLHDVPIVRGRGVSQGGQGHDDLSQWSGIQLGTCHSYFPQRGIFKVLCGLESGTSCCDSLGFGFLSRDEVFATYTKVH